MLSGHTGSFLHRLLTIPPVLLVTQSHWELSTQAAHNTSCITGHTVTLGAFYTGCSQYLLYYWSHSHTGSFLHRLLTIPPVLLVTQSHWELSTQAAHNTSCITGHTVTLGAFYTGCSQYLLYYWSHWELSTQAAHNTSCITGHTVTLGAFYTGCSQYLLYNTAHHMQHSDHKNRILK
ncbi:hypothetical protein EGW08_009016 [Elysia chlorotica]|uniref:Fatty acid desaturase domain-containing protein n=1 Tax=Elysia chlorotica TaxID=188477 RepID=A0A433TNQ9_ELYCH|nr:hypothetical protein EGW08_009016 [Elysia chlorotica]